MWYDINDRITNRKNKLLSYTILYYLHLCSNVKMSTDTLNELFQKLDSVNDPSIPSCALLLIV